MDTFKHGDRVRVIASNGFYIPGEQGIVVGTGHEIVLVKLDRDVPIAGSHLIQVVFKPSALQKVLDSKPSK